MKAMAYSLYEDSDHGFLLATNAIGSEILHFLYSNDNRQATQGGVILCQKTREDQPRELLWTYSI